MTCKEFAIVNAGQRVLFGNNELIVVGYYEDEKLHGEEFNPKHHHQAVLFGEYVENCSDNQRYKPDKECNVYTFGDADDYEHVYYKYHNKITDYLNCKLK